VKKPTAGRLSESSNPTLFYFFSVLMAGAEIGMKVSSLALLFRPLRCSAVAMFGISIAIFQRRTTVEGS